MKKLILSAFTGLAILGSSGAFSATASETNHKLVAEELQTMKASESFAYLQSEGSAAELYVLLKIYFQQKELSQDMKTFNRLQEIENEKLDLIEKQLALLVKLSGGHHAGAH